MLIAFWGEFPTTNTLVKQNLWFGTPERIGYFSSMTVLFVGKLVTTMCTVSYEFLMKPKDLGECHQTLSYWWGQGTRPIRLR